MTQALPPQPEAASLVPDVPWRRLDPRMLLVHPVLELVKFLPVLVGIFVLGSNGNQGWWQLVGVAIPISLGVLRFLTTQFRITATQIELQRGLIGRKVLTARLDRVRAVELTSTPIHRILGLAKVEVGTASGAKQDDDAFALDSLPREEARHLRVALLHRVTVTPAPVASSPSLPPGHQPHEAPAAATVAATAAATVDDEVLMRLDPAWARYAPLTTSGSVIAAALAAVVGQFADRIGARAAREAGTLERVRDYPLAGVVVVAVLVFLVLGAIFGVLGYLVTNGGFTLSRDSLGRSFHVRRGLFTARETSLEVERVRGLHVGEPLGLRLVGAARLAAVVTGVSRKDSGTTLLVPPAPRGVVDATGAAVLGEHEPLELPLVSHGGRARRRRHNRALAGAVVLPLVAILACALGPLPWWVAVVSVLVLPPAVVLAEDRYRRLGHALSRDHLVVRSGTFSGRRDILQRTGIIGWSFQQTWFQRRAGLVTLVATTAAGRQAYAVLDVPESVAVMLAHQAVPGLVEPFLATSTIH